MPDSYFKNRRDYHKLCREKERTYWNKQKQNLYNLRSKDLNIFWNKLIMKPKCKSNNFSKLELYNFFTCTSLSSTEEIAETYEA